MTRTLLITTRRGIRRDDRISRCVLSHLLQLVAVRLGEDRRRHQLAPPVAEHRRIEKETMREIRILPLMTERGLLQGFRHRAIQGRHTLLEMSGDTCRLHLDPDTNF